MAGGFVPKHPWILRSPINNFHYLYQDAEWLHGLAADPNRPSRFEKTRLSRTAVVLYAFSLEALINRAYEAFLPEPIKGFFLEREDRFRHQDKWTLLPLLLGGQESFDTSGYPWSHLVELIGLRNDYAHPKHDRFAYYRLLSPQQMEPLDANQIPPDSDISEKEVLYRQLRIPRDPYSLLPEHLDRVKKVVDDSIQELDRLLAGRLTTGDFLHGDQMTIVYPPGAQFTQDG